MKKFILCLLVSMIVLSFMACSSSIDSRIESTQRALDNVNDAIRQTEDNLQAIEDYKDLMGY